MPVIAAAIHRTARGEKPLSPRKGLGHAANFLYMVFGEKPDKQDVRALDASLVLYAEHENNASTFTGRVVASTLSDIYSAVTAAIGSLKGPLHGGAGLAVMDTLEEIGDAKNADSFLEKALADKRLLMGFGHRVYHRSGDPRAAILMNMARETCRRRGAEKWFDIAHALDQGVQIRKGIIPNVDFYSAPLWRGLGLPPSLFIPVITVSRVAGWCANILEQQEKNRLIRPRASYIGASNRAYKSLRGRP
jgi:citrate synthase